MMKRIRVFADNMITLKKGYNNQVLQSIIQKVVPILSRKPPIYDIECGAVHDADNEQLRIKAALVKNKSQVVHGAMCSVNVYAIDVSTLNETLIYSAPPAVSPDADGYFRTSVTEADLVREIQGEFDYVLDVRIKRFKKTYGHRFYFNALGIFDFALRVRRRLLQLEITRKSVGEWTGY